MDAQDSPVDRLRALNAACAAAQKLTPSSVCAKLGLEEREVLGIFLIGSRLWGTATEQSDWDFEVVCARPNKAGKEVWTLHGGNVDATCVTAALFARRVRDHHFLALVVGWMPLEWRWKRDSKVAIEPGKLDRAGERKHRGCCRCLTCALCAALWKSVHEEATRDWAVAEKKAAKGLHPEAKKVVLHAIRMLRISCQYAESGGGAVPNLWCVDDLAEQMRGEWGAVVLRDAYGAEYDALVERLRRACGH